MRPGMSVTGWVYGMTMAGTTITNVMAGIQYSRITTILNGITKTNTEKIVNKVTTNGNNTIAREK